MEDMVRFIERPCYKTQYASLFQESLFLQKRHTFRRPSASEDMDWRHGWFYDPCADQEPRIGEQSKKAIDGTSPQPDPQVCKMFFEATAAVFQDQDMMIAPNGRSLGSSKTLTQAMVKASHHDLLNLIYKEYHPTKGKQRLHETIHSASLKGFGLQPVRARLHYQWTTTTADAIVQALDMEEPLEVQ